MKSIRQNWMNVAIAACIVIINLIIIGQIGLAYGAYDWFQYVKSYGVYGGYGAYGGYGGYLQGVIMMPDWSTAYNPSLTPTVEACVPAPVIFDPPEGKTFAARSMVLRWRSEYELKQNEVFDALVWPDGSVDPISIGTTRDKLLPVDILTWKHAGNFGKFYWTVRIKRLNGPFISCEARPFSFTLPGLPEPPPRRPPDPLPVIPVVPPPPTPHCRPGDKGCPYQ